MTRQSFISTVDYDEMDDDVVFTSLDGVEHVASADLGPDGQVSGADLLRSESKTLRRTKSCKDFAADMCC